MFVHPRNHAQRKCSAGPILKSMPLFFIAILMKMEEELKNNQNKIRRFFCTFIIVASSLEYFSCSLKDGKFVCKNGVRANHPSKKYGGD